MGVSAPKTMNLSRCSVALRPAVRACGVRAQSTAAEPIGDRIFKADQSLKNVHLYHQSGLALAVAAPLALVYPNLPCDVLLSTAFPLHAYVGLHAVVTDYVPLPLKGAGRAFLAIGTGLTILGMQVINFKGDGMTKSTLRLWSVKEEQKDQ